MKKNLLDKINKFCQYLTQWDSQKDYYVQDLLPNLKEGYKYSEINIEARTLWIELRNETSVDEWKNIIEIIVKVKEQYNDILEKHKKSKIKAFENNNIQSVQQLKEKYNFEGFFHTTDFNNFVSIMKNKKLCSRNYLLDKDMQFSDIAYQDVVRKQEREHNYVRFYYRPKTPTNYINEGIKSFKSLNKSRQRDIGNGAIVIEKYNEAHSPIPVIMIFSPELVQNPCCRYKQTNKQYQAFLSNIQDIKNWDKIFSQGQIDKMIPDWEYEKQCRMAEFLYPQYVTTDKIEKIIFRSNCDKERAEHILDKDSRFIVNKDYFFNNYLYVENYKFSKDKSKIMFKYNIGNCLYQDSTTINDYQHCLKIYKNKKVQFEQSNIFIEGNIGYISIPNNIEWDYLFYSIENNICVEVYND